MLIFEKERLNTASLVFAWSGLVVHGAAIIMRWIDFGHGPYFRLHEVITSDVWIGVLFFLLLCIRYSRLSVAGTFIMPISISLLAWAAFADPSFEPLSPTFKTPWLVLHVLFAKLAYGSILIAFGLSVLYLMKEKKAVSDGGFETAENGNFWTRLPSLEKMDDLSYRYIAFGFIFVAVMIVAGAIWAQQAWGRFWTWDPIETWSLLVWLLYGIFLHLRITYSFKGRRSAWMIIGMLVVSLIYFFFTTYITPTIHQGTTL